jgi:hypothetical protein
LTGAIYELSQCHARCVQENTQGYSDHHRDSTGQ